MSGWIKLYRSIMDSDLWVRGGKFDRRSAWVYLLLQANHKDGRALIGNTFVPVARGSFITSEVELAKKWRWGRTAVRNLLELLEREEMVSIIRVPGKYTKIVVTNYDKYQDKNHTSNDTTQLPAQEPETNVGRTAETQPTNRSRTGDEQVTNINKNEENEKKGKEDKELMADVTPSERDILRKAKEIYPAVFSYEHDLKFIRDLAVDYPAIDLHEELCKWQLWLTEHRQPKNWRLAYRNWCKKAYEMACKKGDGRYANRRPTLQRSAYADLLQH